MLTVRDVEKRFGGVRAVDRLSFDVRRGEVFALLGPNGAGKTTTVRMLMGIIRPDSGSIAFTLSGDTPSEPEPLQLGYLPEDRGLYRDSPILRMLVYFGVLRGMDRASAQRAAEAWLDRFGLRDRAAECVDALSKGNQQKIQFVVSVLHRPAFAVLDEPFSGLDPVNQDAFLDVIRELRDEGMTILLSAHQMQLVERIADRILVMNRGREVLSGSLADIRRGANLGNKLVFAVAGEPNVTPLERHPSVERVAVDDAGEVTLLVREGEPLGDVLRIAGESLDIVGVRSEASSLHDIYVRAVGAVDGDAR